MSPWGQQTSLSSMYFYFILNSIFHIPSLSNTLILIILPFNLMMLQNNSTNRKKARSIPVFLNVYDFSSVNQYAYWFGVGVHHSGVQVHQVEYAYGYHDEPKSGIFEGEPKECEGLKFRKQILIGWTEMNLTDVKRVMKELAHVYKGNLYNLITRNCNHFCNDACLRLTGNSIPNWINRLARIGSVFNCIVPASLTTVRVGIEDDKICSEAEIKAKLRSRSRRFSSFSKSPSFKSLR